MSTHSCTSEVPANKHVTVTSLINNKSTSQLSTAGQQAMKCLAPVVYIIANNRGTGLEAAGAMTS